MKRKSVNAKAKMEVMNNWRMEVATLNERERAWFRERGIEARSGTQEEADSLPIVIAFGTESLESSENTPSEEQLIMHEKFLKDTAHHFQE